MAVSDLVLVFIGFIATLSTIGMFTPMDRLTKVILPFVAMTLWGAFAMSAFDVVVSDGNPPTTETILPLVFIGATFAMMAAAVGAYEIVMAPSKEIEDSRLNSDTFDFKP